MQYSGVTTFQYDSKDQLIQETSTRAGGYTNGFGYDPAGNPTGWKGDEPGAWVSPLVWCASGDDRNLQP